MSAEVFFFERIWPCHAGGYWFCVEGITLDGRIVNTASSALGTAATKSGARRKICRHKREIAATQHPSIDKGGER